MYDKKKAGDAYQQKLEVQLPERMALCQADVEQQRALVEAKQSEKAEQVRTHLAVVTICRLL